ncbi:rod-binding protein [Paracoccus laeviglucosivorans]|uniref:Rod binding protein n=1 Tax=Paracoccus laeviglucosivorans TaxID=1197861 RepID=A0A521F982_9RHOB|nr:rod-binding protein [Paracoccus laeviglucosivorans]SMO92050.1 Rod binding protein [Paracoccus laeviglucosivorans]
MIAVKPSYPVQVNRPRLEASDGLEKAFISEMLKYAGPKPESGAFGGGIGEDQFSSLLTDCYAEAIASRIDLGIL